MTARAKPIAFDTNDPAALIVCTRCGIEKQSTEFYLGVRAGERNGGARRVALTMRQKITGSGRRKGWRLLGQGELNTHVNIERRIGKEREGRRVPAV